MQPLPEYQEWEIRTERDLRLPAFVSLLKAAKLSMLSMFGYRYALSDAGRFVGGDLRGNFYRANSHIQSKREVQENALKFFRPYRFIVQPLPINSTSLAGTITDYIVHLFAGSTDLA